MCYNGYMALIFFVLFLDFLSFSAVIPLLPPLFFDQKQYALLGALLATYPLAQIFSGPILGAFSDETSRKKVLLLSFIGNFLGYGCVALGISLSFLPLLFLGNAIAGLLGGNIPTINAIIADISTPYAKARRYGLSNMIFGLAFVLGPYIASHLSSLYTSYAFLACALCSLVNFGLIFVFFKDDAPSVSWRGHFNLRHIFHCSRPLKQLLFSGFLLFFGWYFFIKFFQVFLFQEFNFSSQQFCELLSYFGACCVITQLLFILFLHKLASPRRFVLFFLFVLAFSILSLLYIEQEIALWLIVTLFSVAYSLIAPCFTTLISNAESTQEQGKAMGLYQSMAAVAKVMAPGLAGLVLTMQTNLPLFISSAAILSSGILFFFLKKSETISLSSYGNH